MKNLFFIFLFTVSACSLFARDRNQYIGLQKSAASEIRIAAPYDYASDITAKIISVIGLKPNFEVKAAKVPNAAAVVYQGKRYVLYNPTFINALVKTAGNEWAAVSVLAHEIGHHLNGHTLTNHGSRPPEELEADEFSGFVLRRMGASLSEAQVAMKIAANARQTATHPAKYDRLVAIENGWKNADNQIAGKQDVAINKPGKSPWEPKAQPQRTSPIAEKYIAANVHFNADQKGEYYVTTRLNLVKVENDQLLVIGRLSKLANDDFPFVIHDNQKTRLLVNNKGKIFNTRGTAVGYLKLK
jgi:hypothetical protein